MPCRCILLEWMNEEQNTFCSALWRAVFHDVVRSNQLSQLIHFVRGVSQSMKMLGSNGLRICFCSPVSMPNLKLCFCFLSHCHLLSGMVNHKKPGFLATSAAGMLWEQRNPAAPTTTTADILCAPVSRSLYCSPNRTVLCWATVHTHTPTNSKHWKRHWHTEPLRLWALPSNNYLNVLHELIHLKTLN